MLWKEWMAVPFKIDKDTAARTHACLIGWDELNSLSARVSEITGHAVDYQQLDINNVLLLPKLLQAEEGRRTDG